LKHYVIPDHHRMLPEECKTDWQISQYLTIEEDRLLIPHPMCAKVLSQLYDAHQGPQLIPNKGRIL